MDKDKLRTAMHQVFTPGFPIGRRDFFKGRASQLARILETVPSPGRHPIIFGQRGVGKTSLANILHELLPDFFAVKITCDWSDTFHSVWNRILQKATITFKQMAFGFSREESEKRTNLAAFLGRNGEHSVSAAEVAEVLTLLKRPALFIIDEYDRLTDPSVKAGMASLIKNVSDNNPHATLVLVGVSENIGGLIGEHPSVERNLVQVELPPMTNEEIKEIVGKGMEQLQLSLSAEVLEDVVFLAGGFPHYAHLLGLSICKACLIRDVEAMDRPLFEELACSLAIEDSIESYREAYTKASRTAQQSRYPQILCACGLAKHDERGVFRATDVVQAMADTYGESLTVQAVVPALQAFSEIERGAVLEKVPFGNTSHYRFREPMMRPFLRIKARSMAKVE